MTCFQSPFVTMLWQMKIETRNPLAYHRVTTDDHWGHGSLPACSALGTCCWCGCRISRGSASLILKNIWKTRVIGQLDPVSNFNFRNIAYTINWWWSTLLSQKFVTDCDYIVTAVLRHNVDILVDQTASTGKCTNSFIPPTPINISHLQDIVFTQRRGI